MNAHDPYGFRSSPRKHPLSVMLREGGASSNLSGFGISCALTANPAITGSSACADDDTVVNLPYAEMSRIEQWNPA
jgi:hypothetical protein